MNREGELEDMNEKGFSGKKSREREVKRTIL